MTPKNIETDRLFFRELQPDDDAGMFALDSNPNVHRFVGNRPQTEIQQSRDVIAYVRSQYETTGIGRYAAIEKATGEFIGWAGLKVERNVNGRGKFWDIGYRLREEFWGKGYATEATIAFLAYGFHDFKAEKINAYTDSDNKASQRILEKCGLKHTETFEHEGKPWFWYEITKEEYEK
ncbi:GNAT family N-acetyltransferase [Flavobacterium silvaticum]|uniref:GNAT family N-acetyltransferase n=1 Tax=Flavobacterium silvaticum TaxID=1852020 RepID=A0A972FQ61_9FLAO|nr:GNAT family N-acetyltransferase [Flavobacterium silvaticum]NMH29320.1 GNAT family N-acetyltransferase [Flavobacterium silvaticum]